jgi:hypothetical protein
MTTTISRRQPRQEGIPRERGLPVSTALPVHLSSLEGAAEPRAVRCGSFVVCCYRRCLRLRCHYRRHPQRSDYLLPSQPRLPPDAVVDPFDHDRRSMHPRKNRRRPGRSWPPPLRPHRHHHYHHRPYRRHRHPYRRHRRHCCWGLPRQGRSRAFRARPPESCSGSDGGSCEACVRQVRNIERKIIGTGACELGKDKGAFLLEKTAPFQLDLPRNGRRHARLPNLGG